MLKKILAAVGAVGAASAAAPQSSRAFTPYREAGANAIYNLLFCDDLDLFKSAGNGQPEGPWAVLLAAAPVAADLRAIAEDESQESRLRVLAYGRLRQSGQPVPAKKLLGVVIEAGLEGGLDVLAAFADGRVRYINHTGAMSIFDHSPAEVAARARNLLAASQPVVERIGPWDKARLAPPGNGTVRLNFLVSDGHYFGQGPMAQFRVDAMAGPVLAAAEALLAAVVELSAKK